MCVNYENTQCKRIYLIHNENGEVVTKNNSNNTNALTRAVEPSKTHKKMGLCNFIHTICNDKHKGIAFKNSHREQFQKEIKIEFPIKSKEEETEE